ncbi:MAG: cytochrome c [Alphaproteobacteria bacterium]|nr:cytochrome c [Alphaproteobacteria bacterium]MBU1515452.1 cytochrome c [Alphaproteobacteria bacterium]MBU2095450.1 cytochrome c [Alphaproteobacteria bacterium]MBU2150692.1 cytochrome c [Alphaproteobacteria bacterium]MBU2306956.1 cytochrome c [Alphaproteobacteria bacterium]
MRLRTVGSLAALAFAMLAAPASGEAVAPTVRGGAIFAERCKECHDPGDDRAPPRAVLATKTVDEIVAALTTGPMAPVAEGLTPDDKRAVATYLTAK